MTANVELVKRLNKAAESRDIEAVRSLLHPNYSLKDPMMELNSAEEFLQFMKDCPFTCHLENVKFLEDGDKVVQTLDAVMDAPVAFRFRMCDIVSIEDGRVRSEEVFYDTARMPKEAKDIAEKGLRSLKKAA